eukprot:g58819.t1
MEEVPTALTISIMKFDISSPSRRGQHKGILALFTLRLCEWIWHVGCKIRNDEDALEAAADTHSTRGWLSSLGNWT